MSGRLTLKLLYRTAPGRAALKLLTAPALSRLAGAFLSSGLSRALIGSFIRRNNIDMSDYAPRKYRHFNDFFTRELKEGARVFDMSPDALIAPCDGKLSIYPVTPDGELTIKSQKYTVASLLRDQTLAKRFEGGLALVFRLSVDDYHRYCFFDGGRPVFAAKIPGRLHTVRPIALQSVPVFSENAREYLYMNTDSFGDAIQMEVGAIMVGKIKNRPARPRFERGSEKGMFEFGGSTVVVILQANAALLRADAAACAGKDIEIPVRLGEKIGQSFLGVNR